MSLKLKILGCIIIIAVLGAIVGFILLNGNNEANQTLENNQIDDIDNSISENVHQDTENLDGTPEGISDYEQVEFFFVTLNGYWTSGNLFFAFINKDGKHFVQYGLYGASYGETGEIKDAKVTGTNTFSLTIVIPAKPADEMSDARPEKTETVYVDVSNHKSENRLNVKLDNEYIGGKEWHTYEYGGTTLEEAFIDGMIPEY